MDYEIGSIANLISGTLTPNRPKLIKRARTPVKHQQSPNVTPRSELLVDREMFMSPSLQKKKAMVKKSPKRIFQRDDLDKTNDAEISPSDSSTLEKLSTKAAKVKKHLRADLGEDKKEGDAVTASPKRKKKARKELADTNGTSEESAPLLSDALSEAQVEDSVGKSPKKKNKKRKLSKKNEETSDAISTGDVVKSDQAVDEASPKKKNKKKKKKKGVNKSQENNATAGTDIVKKHISQDKNGDTSSEHESDNEIESETEQEVKQILDSGPIEGEDSSDDETTKKTVKAKDKTAEVKEHQQTEEEIRRTLFVGNVPITKKCKKEVKQLFRKYGIIDSVRIRTVPVKDLNTAPKLALIKNEIHPERTSANVYVKFRDAASVDKALVENNTVMGQNHLRVTRSDITGQFHDPKKTLFVGNMPFGIEDEVLRATFENCGEIESVRVIRDKKSQIGKGFGYVNFASKDGVELALTLSEEDLTIKNRILRLNRCSVRPNKPKGNFHPANKERQGGWGGNNQWKHGNSNGNYKGKPRSEGEPTGALKRLNNKRKLQEYTSSSQAPPEKKQRKEEHAGREKKMKKEFVGITAEKKKKKKVKGQKNKKKLSEILTKS